MKKRIYGLIIILAGMLSFGTVNASTPVTKIYAEDSLVKRLEIEIVQISHDGYTWTYVYSDGELVWISVS